ncbi:MAG: 5'-nucleotidase [Desulfurococcales archaeon]|jgi:large subunit ribosomal protein L38e|nr:5'-nucleotidase [Desulfurococcales archaeon]
MPIFIKDLEEFKRVAEKAIECRVVKNEKKKIGKLKARTKRYLYTYIAPLDKIDEIVKSIKCQNIVEISKGKSGEEK